MNPKSNFKNYRTALSECEKNDIPCVPFLGVSLSDFTVCSLGTVRVNSCSSWTMEIQPWSMEMYWTSKRREWWERYWEISAICEVFFQEIKRLRKCVRVPYDTQKYPYNLEVAKFLLETETWKDDDLYRISQMREKATGVTLRVGVLKSWHWDIIKATTKFSRKLSKSKKLITSLRDSTNAITPSPMSER